MWWILLALLNKDRRTSPDSAIWALVVLAALLIMITVF
jgi:hypothetical protein